MNTDVDKEALRVAAMARVLTECFDKEERADLLAEALKPLFKETKCDYGGVVPSVFNESVVRALDGWTRKAVDEYLQCPEVVESIQKQLKAQCDAVIEEQMPKWVEELIRRRNA